jgi:hypothetical protein
MSASKLNARSNASAQLVRAGNSVPALTNPSAAPSSVTMAGRFKVEHWRAGQRINEYQFNNGIVNEGKDKLLNVMFDATAAIVTWNMGIIDDALFSALAAADTYDDIDQAGNGWDEFTLYTDANRTDSATTRPEWGPDAASAQAITNSTVAIYDITGSGTVKGIFTVGGTNSELKSNHEPGPTLWATALFTSGDVVVQNGDQLKVTYTVSA